MKFLVKNREEGIKIKEKLIEKANEWDYIFLSDVLLQFDRVPDPSTYEFAWPSEYVKNGKIQVKQYKDSWFVYIFGEPKKVEKSDPLKDLDITVLETEIFEKLVKAIDNIRLSMDGMVDRIIERWMNYEVDVFTGFEKLGEVIGGHYGYFYRPCIVKAKKSGRKEERQDRNAKFHRWADVTKSVHQVVAIVEFYDGHIEQVTPTRIMFYEEETEDANML